MRWEEILARYDVIEDEIALGGHTLRFARVRDINAVVDAMGPDDFGADERLPYWCALWPAALALARLVLERAPLGGPVLELGCGMGLVSVAAARAGAEVTASDYEAEPLAFARRNAELNGVALATEQWDWRDAAGIDRRFALVLASDVIYEARQVVPVADALAARVAVGGVALVADPGRPQLPALEQALADRGFRAEKRVFESIAIISATRLGAPQI